MPLYEYRCNACGKRFTFLYGVVADSVKPQCPSCSSEALTKLISRVRRLRGEEEVLEGMAESASFMDMEDPRALRSFARRMSKELGSEIGEDFSDEFEEMIETEMQSEKERGGSEEQMDEKIY